MSFDQNFSNRKNSQIRKEGPSVYFYHNLIDIGFEDLKINFTGDLSIDGPHVITEIENTLINKDFHYEIMYTSLLKEGALTIPIVLSIEGVNYSLFFIYSEDELQYLNDLIIQVKRTEYSNLILFSTIPVVENSITKSILYPFKLSDLYFEEDIELEGDFAMWWSCEEELCFDDNQTFKYLKSIYRSIKGFESCFYTYILHQISGEKRNNLARKKLPKEEVNFVLKAPQNKHVILQISQEKGIRFLFEQKSTSFNYKLFFLEGITKEFYEFRILLENQEISFDKPLEYYPEDWLEFICLVIKNNETEGNHFNLLGGFCIEE